MFTVRHSEPKDYTELLPLMKSYFDDLPNLSYTIEYLINMFQKCWISPQSSLFRNWLILRDNQITGFIIGNITETIKNNAGVLTFHIIACKVEGGNREHSYKLLQEIRKELLDSGIARITLSVDTKYLQNNARITLFQQYDFHVKSVLMELE